MKTKNSFRNVFFGAVKIFQKKTWKLSWCLKFPVYICIFNWKLETLKKFPRTSLEVYKLNKCQYYENNMDFRF